MRRPSWEATSSANQLEAGGGAPLTSTMFRLTFAVAAASDLAPLSAALADNDAPRAEDVDLTPWGVPVWLSTVRSISILNASSVRLLLQGLADLVILKRVSPNSCLEVNQRLSHLYNAHAHAMGINFLAHLFYLLVFLFQHNSHAGARFRITALARHNAVSGRADSIPQHTGCYGQGENCIPNKVSVQSHQSITKPLLLMRA